MTASSWCPSSSTSARSAQISRWTDELQAQPEVPGGPMMYFEQSLLEPGERVLQRIENFCPFDARFAELCDADKLKAVRVQALRRARRAVQGQDQLQAARWRRLQAAPGPAGGLERLRGPLHHRHGQHRCHLRREWVPGAVRRPPHARAARRRVDAAHRRRHAPARRAPGADRPRGTRCSSTRTRPTRRPRTSPSERRRVLYITYNRQSAGDHRARYFADKRKSFPPDVEREPGRTYTFRV